MHQLSVAESAVASESSPQIEIGYIGGGSRGWALTLINDLLQCTDVSGRVSLYDVNYEPAAQNAELGNRLADRDDVDGDWTFEPSRTLEEALEGADFVICSIQDPPEETFVHDIDVPQKYGIYQTVGDTVGPGGTMRALRAIPQYRKIAAAIREQCPDAWVINYTNPMTVCTRTLYEEFPDVKAIGLCHEVFKAQGIFAKMAEKFVTEAEDVSRDEIDINVKGINHFTWVDEAYWRDHDVFQYLDRELEDRKPIPNFEPGDLDGESYMLNHSHIPFDLYDQFGLLGAAGDRHLVEFVPWYLDVEEPSGIQRWGLRATPSSERASDDDGPDEVEQYLAGEEEFEFRQSGEEAVDIIRALLGLEAVKTHVNYPNVGQIPDLTTGAIVETNAMVTGDSVSPISAGEFPREVRNMIMTHVNNQETLIEAGFTGDLDLAFQAFLNEPLVTIQRHEAAELFAELVEIERDYLEDYGLEGADVLSE